MRITFLGAMMVGLLACTHSLHAQSSVTATLGASTMFLDNGFGLHVGLNYHHDFTSRVAAEGQLSNQLTQVTSGFLSGGEDQLNTTAILVGGRVYFTDAEGGARWYANALIGPMLQYTASTDATETYLGATVGIYRASNRWVLGLAAESPQHVLLKVGYRL